MHPLLQVFVGTVLTLLPVAWLLPLLTRWGGPRFDAWVCRAPALDWIVAFFTISPWVAGFAVAGWTGAVVALGGQLAALWLWIMVHEAMHLGFQRGPRIHRTLGAMLGAWRNHAALWLMLPAVTVFWVVRLGEVLLYPPVRLLARLPKYRSADWVSVSRHKFNGLIGHDLIWCLYCDWMTGIWALGSEVLRNIESFWCPLRFADATKCENCKIDFPDLETDWIKADGRLSEVVALLQEKYSSGNHSWFGHPSRFSTDHPRPEGSLSSYDDRLTTARPD